MAREKTIHSNRTFTIGISSRNQSVNENYTYILRVHRIESVKV
jgi:hypothetical protein